MKLFKLDSRTKKMGKNSIFLLILQILSISLNLLLVPVTINYVNSDIYGIWLTLSSVVAWISILNIGLNQSLRNRFTEAKTLGNDFLARKYVSTTYILLTLIFGFFLILFIIVNPIINWSKVLNLDFSLNNELRKAMLIIVSYFCLRFILSSINVILLADHKSAESSLRNFAEQLFSFIIIYILTKTTDGSLLNLSLALCIPPVLLLLLFNVMLFRKRYKKYAPSLSCVDFTLTKDLLSVGLNFFVINIAGIIQFQLANFIILKYFGGEQVTCYNIAFKYFNVAYTIFALLLTPLWSATTEAKVKNDYQWIKMTVKRYLSLSVIFILGLLVMLIFSSNIYHIWLQNNFIHIPFFLSAIIALYVATFIFGGVFVTILNGMGIINIQMKICVISPFVYLIMCYFFLKYSNIGLIGIVISAIVSNFNGWIVAPVQVYKILSKK